MNNNINWVAKPADKGIIVKDKKLIRIIYANSRMPLKDIGKKLHLSKVAAYNRLKNLEKRKVITGYSCLINFSKLGFSTYQIGIKTNMNLEEKENYIKKIQDCGYVSQVLKLAGGKWDFLIRILSQEKDLNKILDLVKDSKIQEEDILKINGLFAHIDGEKEFSLMEKRENALSDSEIELLLQLAKNSRQSVVDLSTKIKVSPKTIINKINKFQQDKIIISFPTEYNPLTYGDEAYLLVITTKNRAIQNALANQLSKINSVGVFTNLQNPNIISFHIISGLNELKNVEKTLQPFINEIRNYEFIRMEEQSIYNFFPDGVYKNLIKI
jgi:DNA-binding Lrp family transcriptional regulator